MNDNNTVYDDEIDLMDIVTVLWKRKIMIAAGTLIVVFAALIYVTFATKVYQVEMKVKPAVLEIDDENKIIYATDPEQIKGRIESEIYGQKILNRIYAQGSPALPDELKFKVDIPKDADLVNIIYESPDIDLAIKIQKELGKLLAADDFKILKNKKEGFDGQIRMKQSVLLENANIEKSFMFNVSNAEKRIGQMTEDIAQMTENNTTLKKQRNKFMSMPADGTNSLSVLLYSNTIQQTLQLINDVKAQLTNQRVNKERMMQKIISLKRARADVNEEIKYLKFRLGTMREMEIVSPPVAGKYPVKPKKSLVVILSFVTGLFVMVFASFIVDYIDNYRKKEVETNRAEAI